MFTRVAVAPRCCLQLQREPCNVGGLDGVVHCAALSSAGSGHRFARSLRFSSKGAGRQFVKARSEKCPPLRHRRTSPLQ
jgi:hypothetical protein